LGYLKDELHAVFAHKFLPPHIIEALGEKVMAVRSTASLEVVEFSAYLNQIELFCQTELSIRLPHPDDLYYDALLKEEKGREAP